MKKIYFYSLPPLSLFFLPLAIDFFVLYSFSYVLFHLFNSSYSVSQMKVEGLGKRECWECTVMSMERHEIARCNFVRLLAETTCREDYLREKEVLGRARGCAYFFFLCAILKCFVQKGNT